MEYPYNNPDPLLSISEIKNIYVISLCGLTSYLSIILCLIKTSCTNFKKRYYCLTLKKGSS